MRKSWFKLNDRVELPFSIPVIAGTEQAVSAEVLVTSVDVGNGMRVAVGMMSGVGPGSPVSVVAVTLEVTVRPSGVGPLPVHEAVSAATGNTSMKT